MPKTIKDLTSEEKYNLRQKINNALYQVQQFNTTVTHKKFHYNKLEECKLLIYNHCYDINQWYFDENYSYLYEYNKMVNRDYKETQKIKMDNYVKLIKKNLYIDLNQILKYMEE